MSIFYFKGSVYTNIKMLIILCHSQSAKNIFQICGDLKIVLSGQVLLDCLQVRQQLWHLWVEQQVL